MQNKVLIIDFGSQYTQLIARRFRELFIYCEISPFNNLPSDMDQFKAVVLSGSPFSVNQVDSPDIDLKMIMGLKPVIAICYGAQLVAKNLTEVLKIQIQENMDVQICLLLIRVVLYLKVSV